MTKLGGGRKRVESQTTVVISVAQRNDGLALSYDFHSQCPTNRCHAMARMRVVSTQHLC